MCIKSNPSSRVQTTKKAKTVWKVTCEDRTPLFYSEHGIELFCLGSSWKRLPRESKPVQLAFNIGYGYCLFERKKTAKQYAKAVENRFNAAVEVHKAEIPAKIKYQHGKIDKFCVGAGIEAIRAEQYLFVEAANG